MIDDHAHPFPLEFVPLELESVSLDARSDAAAPARRLRAGAGRLFQELLTGALARLLSVEGDEPADVVAARDGAAKADWRGYVRRLFEDAAITGMILDEGVSTAKGGPISAYGELTGTPIWRLARIDPLVDELVAQKASAHEVVRAVEEFMDGAASNGAVGFKTIVAYRSGLGIDPSVTMREAADSLAHSHDEGVEVPVRRRAKALRDLVVRTVLERAADLGRPVQIHTGFGDSDLRLSDSNPLLLEPLLDHPAGSAAAVVLIHGSYPWQEEVGYLATVRPNVYAELSLSNLFAPLRLADRLAALVDLTPREKLLAGSDGHGPPETHWFACRQLHAAFEVVADRLAIAGARRSFAEATRRAMLEENARELYGLG